MQKGELLHKGKAKSVYADADSEHSVMNFPEDASVRKFDKDRFRRDLGNVVEANEVVAQRLEIPLSLSN